MRRTTREERDLRKLAYKAFNKAISDGLIVRPTKCESDYTDHSSGTIEAHHFLGYEPEHWLDIRWLCRKCHRKEDVKMYRRNGWIMPRGPRKWRAW